MSWNDLLYKTNKGLTGFFREEEEPEHNELLGSAICRCKACREKRGREDKQQ